MLTKQNNLLQYAPYEGISAQKLDHKTLACDDCNS